MKNNLKWKNILIGITILLVIILLGVVIWQVWMIKSKNKSSNLSIEKEDNIWKIKQWEIDI